MTTCSSGCSDPATGRVVLVSPSGRTWVIASCDDHVDDKLDVGKALGFTFDRLEPVAAMTDEEATVEVGWVAHEAIALISERVPRLSERWEAYLERKRALLDLIDPRPGV